MARKLTPDAIERVIGALSMGADLMIAARIVGVSREALRKYCAKNPATALRMDEAKSFADERVVKSLFNKALAGDTTAMIFWLKNRQPTAWRDRRELAGDPKAPLFSGPIRLIVDGDDADDDAAE